MIFKISSEYYLVCTYILSTIIGLCVGSFLNVVIYRLPNNMSLAFPSSHCPKCGYTLKWYDNIPVLSYLMLGGKCRSCKEKISFRYTLVEILTCLLFIISVYVFNSNVLYMLLSFVVSSISILIMFIDIEHMIIFDRFQIVLLVVGILSIFIDTTISWYSHLIGFSISLGFFLIEIVCEKLIKKEVIGGGDIKFIAVSGLILGYERMILMLFISFVICLIYILIKRIKKVKLKEFPFGPFLVLGLLISLFLGNCIISLYLSLLV